jgi:hypothetical protein
MNNEKDIKKALKAVDKWLKSEDVFVTDSFGNVIPDCLVQCKPLSLTKRLVFEYKNETR